MRRTLKARLSKLEKQSAAPRIDVLWVDIDRGETHEGVIKGKYGDQVPSDVEPITVSWMPQETQPGLVMPQIAGDRMTRARLVRGGLPLVTPQFAGDRMTDGR